MRDSYLKDLTKRMIVKGVSFEELFGYYIKTEEHKRKTNTPFISDLKRNVAIIRTRLEGNTLKETSIKHGLTPERVRQIVAKFAQISRRFLSRIAEDEIEQRRRQIG